MSEQDIRTRLHQWTAAALAATGTEATLKILVKKLASTDPTVRRTAAEAIAQITDEEQLDQLLALLNAPDSPVPHSHPEETRDCLTLPRLRIAASNPNLLTEPERVHLRTHCTYCDKTIRMFQEGEPLEAGALGADTSAQSAAQLPFGLERGVLDNLQVALRQILRFANQARVQLAVALLPQLSAHSFATTAEEENELMFSRTQVGGTHYHFDGSERLTLQHTDAPPGSLLYLATLDSQGNPDWVRFAILVPQGGQAPAQAHVRLAPAPETIPSSEDDARVLSVLPVTAAELSAPAAPLLQQSFLLAHQDDPYAIRSGVWQRWAEEGLASGEAIQPAIRQVLESIRDSNLHPE